MEGKLGKKLGMGQDYMSSRPDTSTTTQLNRKTVLAAEYLLAQAVRSGQIGSDEAALILEHDVEVIEG